MNEYEKTIKRILKKDERSIEVKEKKVIFKLNQEQEYTIETARNILKNLREKKKQYKEWLNNYRLHLKEAEKLVRRQLKTQKEKLEKEVKKLDEGIKIWKKIE